MKKYIKLGLLLLILLTLASTAYAQNEITIYYNGVKLSSDVNPIIVEGRTMVPARSIFERAGYELKWIAETKTVIATKGLEDVTIIIDDPIVDISHPLGGGRVELDVPAQIVNGRTLIPLNVISNLNHFVEWDGTTYTVNIYTATYYADLKEKRLIDGIKHNGDGSMFITKYDFDSFKKMDHPNNSNEVVTSDPDELEKMMENLKIKLDRDIYTPVIWVGNYLFLEHKNGSYYENSTVMDFLDLSQGALVHARDMNVKKTFIKNGKLDAFFIRSTWEIPRFYLLDSSYNIIEDFMISGYTLKYKDLGPGHFEVQYRNIYDKASDLFTINNLTYEDGKLYADVNGVNMLFSEFVESIEYKD